ncbi:MAG: hypothetical protein KTR30_33660 [Saprospiraceae bacterium]|nr:hypothetical protein [Saprospiraceae bacterium]
MKSLFFSLFLCLTACCLTAQDQPTKWSVSIGLGLEAHDERLFDFPNAERIIQQEQDAGTRYYSLFLKRKLPLAQGLNGSIGLGYTQKVATFSRPFDHCYFSSGDCAYVLLYVERFTHQMLQVPIDLNYSLWTQNSWNLGFNLNLLPAFSWQQAIETTNQANTFEKSEFQPYTLELHLGPTIKWKRISLQLQYRVFQWIQKEDAYLYGSDFRLNNPGYFDQRSESFNPNKFWMLVDYSF